MSLRNDIDNGVDMERLSLFSQSDVPRETLRTQYGIPKDAFVVGRMGRLAFDKCFEEWMIACKKFQDSGLCENPYFLIVGGEAASTPGYEGRLKVMAASLPLKNTVFVPAVESAGWALEAMDIFMYPSPTEGFGLAYIEAMAFGVPTILWDNELTREIAMGGAMLCGSNIQALHETLAYLFLNPSIRQQFAEAGKLHVIAAGFTVDKMVEKYCQTYLEFKETAVAAV